MTTTIHHKQRFYHPFSTASHRHRRTHTAMTTPPPQDTATLEATAEIDVDEHPAEGVTAGYDPERNTWHVEVHRTGRPIEIHPVEPDHADQTTARLAAEQLAEILEYPHIEDNRGLHPAATILEQVRAAAWMQGEDDPALVAEVARLRAVENDTVTRGWNLVTAEPAAVSHSSSEITYIAAGMPVTANPDGTVTTGAGEEKRSWTPEEARCVAAALITAAKDAESLVATMAGRPRLMAPKYFTD